MTDHPRACPTCGSPLIRRPPLVLGLSGLAFAAIAAAAILLSPRLFLIAFVAFLIACYLLTWAIAARGYWCRNCKTFPTRRL